MDGSDDVRSTALGVTPELLAGHRVLVTDAASGIGKATAAACRAAGATVVGADIVAEIPGTIRCDVRSEDDVTALFAGLAGQPTDVIHCAGIAESAPIGDAALAVAADHRRQPHGRLPRLPRGCSLAADAGLAHLDRLGGRALEVRGRALLFRGQQTAREHEPESDTGFVLHWRASGMARLRRMRARQVR